MRTRLQIESTVLYLSRFDPRTWRYFSVSRGSNMPSSAARPPRLVVGCTEREKALTPCALVPPADARRVAPNTREGPLAVRMADESGILPPASPGTRAEAASAGVVSRPQRLDSMPEDASCSVRIGRIPEANDGCCRNFFPIWY